MRSLLEEITEKNRLEGHGDDVLAIEVVANEEKTLIASASLDRSVKFWQIDGYEERSFYWGSEELLKICDIALSPDASLIAKISSKGELELLEYDTGQSKFLVQLYEDKDNKGKDKDKDKDIFLSFRVCFVSDGKRILASSHKNKNLKIINLEGELQKSIKHSSNILGIDFNSTKKLIASVTENQKLYIWDLGGNLRYELSTDVGKRVKFLNVVFNSNGSMVAVSCSDSTVRVWNLERSKEKPLNFHFKRMRMKKVYSSSFSPCGNYLAAACEDGIIRIYKLSSPDNAVDVFIGHNDQVRAVRFVTQELVVSGSDDNTLRIWKFRQQDLSYSPEQQNDLDFLLREACLWLDDYLRNNRNLDLGDRYICTDI